MPPSMHSRLSLELYHEYCYNFFIGRFGLICTGDENRTLTIQCEGIGGIVNGSEVACVYDSGPMQEKCL